jgi:hypothetical protein
MVLLDTTGMKPERKALAEWMFTGGCAGGSEIQ